MAYAMTKVGSLDNQVTYEFMCDGIADMNLIENRYRTIGSVAIVLTGTSGGMEVYICGSDKAWKELAIGASGNSATSGLSIYICAQNEVTNGMPNIQSPDTETIYLVPAGNTSGNLYEEYIYVNNAWEKFGSGNIAVDLSNYITKTDNATYDTLGLVKAWTGGGIGLSASPEDGRLYIYGAQLDTIKQGTHSYQPIVPGHQHQSVFYGLAKAAGDSTQTISDNAVGTYTDNAKTAIRSMIGAGTYNKPNDGIPASDLASGVIPTVPVTDVQVNGTSILDAGVANVPVGDNNNLGAVKTANNYGIFSDNGTIKIDGASDAQIKDGNSAYRPIVPSKQEKSVFFGLAKAAGDSTQAVSDNAVGTYTDDAKTAICNMIGAGTYSKPNNGIPASDLAAGVIPSVPVQDVQVNGTSILQNGVANIPYGSTSEPGLLQTAGLSYGLGLINDKILYISGAADSDIKAGTNLYKPIVSGSQHKSIYYGLAKLAGADMASVTGETIGVYPETQKIAIRNMIGAGTYSKPSGGIPAADLADTYLTAHQDISGLVARVAELETQVASLMTALRSILVPANAITDESGEPLTDESGNYIEFD